MVRLVRLLEGRVAPEIVQGARMPVVVLSAVQTYVLRLLPNLLADLGQAWRESFDMRCKIIVRHLDLARRQGEVVDDVADLTRNGQKGVLLGATSWARGCRTTRVGFSLSAGVVRHVSVQWRSRDLAVRLRPILWLYVGPSTARGWRWEFIDTGLCDSAVLNAAFWHLELLVIILQSYISKLGPELWA